MNNFVFECIILKAGTSTIVGHGFAADTTDF